ncbi:MAG: ABC transporter ATP-binding protein [Anaerolineales bacterium]|jgi:ABC-2 type transport system ATP-binding protein|nr:ABC transporter ATP-binding protein [Anaerolineales bacterium]
MITISSLSKTYPGNVHALREVTLEIGTGMFGLLGPNGAGKTTLMRILAGILSPTGGTATILGHNLTTPAGKQAVKESLGYLPQELGLYPDLTAAEFLDYIAILKGINDGNARKRQITELLDLVRLTDKANARIKTYSGGMKRRVGIAQALLGSPQLIIVDEPTAGLDPEERIRFRNLLVDTAARCTVILSTHIVEDIGQSCNDLAVIRQGQVLYRGSPRELIAQARGNVWNITMTDGARPDGGLTIVSTLQLAEGVQYRVVGKPESQYPAQPAEPSLEDGYMWLMKEK